MPPKEKATRRTTRLEGWRQIIHPVPGEQKGNQYRIQLRDDVFFIFVDSVQVNPNGDLLGLRQMTIEYAFAAGTWLFCLPVSALDGSELVAAWYSRWLDS
jgi:hypothetical protein